LTLPGWLILIVINSSLKERPIYSVPQNYQN
jgi:hypothetical protein